MPRALWRSSGGQFLMSEVPMYLLFGSGLSLATSHHQPTRIFITPIRTRLCMFLKREEIGLFEIGFEIRDSEFGVMN